MANFKVIWHQGQYYLWAADERTGFIVSAFINVSTLLLAAFCVFQDWFLSDEHAFENSITVTAVQDLICSHSICHQPYVKTPV